MGRYDLHKRNSVSDTSYLRFQRYEIPIIFTVRISLEFRTPPQRGLTHFPDGKSRLAIIPATKFNSQRRGQN